jgi:hypothetical protein
MKARGINLVWGLGLIAAGAVFLLQNMGLLGEFSPQVWAIIFAVLSLMFFATYLINGIADWGWLFPALIFAALSIIILRAEAGSSGAWMGSLILGAVSIPFLVAFGLAPKQRWWALIPAWVLLILALIVSMSDTVAGEVIGGLVLFAIGLPFFVVYLTDRSRWWALLPAIILSVLGVVTLIATRAPGELIGALVMFGIALPFFWIYLQNTSERWWAFIPAGVLTSVGFSSLLSGGEDFELQRAGISMGVLFLGIGLTFYVLWLRRAKHPTEWAIYPALVGGIAGVASFFLDERMELIWPLAVILLGVIMLFGALRPKRAA